ncbi:arabinose-5-phosphate isomerase [Natronospira proteinivora]|uniref:Arabinose 5-phosphate isomerase n=1 Tax=Natronospira proteinivora TaxID=1807133 RepID=A0ABT1G450_9GAMM|nr:KpsF/GutQ family sugar-phosphate isomerase [Natronospira proteinivora]MCP1726079.1 arabinose-5-phosphate isomerase [Natronospira proteinivora]
MANPKTDSETATPERALRLAQDVLELEADSVRDLVKRLGDDFIRAWEICLACRGRIVVTGMGKSGHIAGKVAATLASTGTPAFFVHPGEASHGDLGMITGEDAVMALSNSGETGEVLTILPLIKRLGVPLISMTGRPDSTLARAADANLDVSVAREACPLNLAPTSSTTASLAMGDALAVALLESRGFTQEDFARSHPGGSLGRRLLLRLEDLMHSGDAVPAVQADTPMRNALLEMTLKGLGMTAVVNEERQVLGIFTDGDLRRSLDRQLNVHNTPIRDVMTPAPRTVNREMLAGEALKLMETQRINQLLITDTNGRLVGALNMHDMLRAGVV